MENPPTSVTSTDNIPRSFMVFGSYQWHYYIFTVLCEPIQDPEQRRKISQYLRAWGMNTLRIEPFVRALGNSN